MNCRNCAREIPAAAKFCPECGARTSASCAACGVELLEGAKFCAECGAAQALVVNPRFEREPRAYTPKHLADRILTSRTALEGERKQVTVLFADVTGLDGARRAGRPRGLARDPRPLLRDPHRRRAPLRGHGQPVHRRRHHGAVRRADRARGPRASAPATRRCTCATSCARYAQDAAPRARPRRSRCAWASTPARSWSARSATTCAWTTPRRATPSASRRAWSSSRARHASTSPSTRRALVDGLLRAARPRRRSRSRACAEPVRVYALAGAGALRTRLDVARAARALALRRPRRRAGARSRRRSRARRHGRGQVVGVVAEAGVGKSRLCVRVRRALPRARRRGVRGARARRTAPALPYLPVLELLRSCFGIARARRAADARARRSPARLLLLDDGFRAAAAALRLPRRPRSASGRRRRRRTPTRASASSSTSLRRLVRERARAEPTVPLLEDLHWIDAASDAFLGAMVDGTRADAHAVSVAQLPPGVPRRLAARRRLPRARAARRSATRRRRAARRAARRRPVARRARARASARAPAATRSSSRRSCSRSCEAGALAGRARRATGSPRPVDDARHSRHRAGACSPRASTACRSASKDVLQTAAVIGKRVPSRVLRARRRLLARAELAAALRQLRRAPSSVFERRSTRSRSTRSSIRSPRRSRTARSCRAARARARRGRRSALEALARRRARRARGAARHHWEAAGDALQAARWHHRAAEWVVNDSVSSNDHWKAVRRLLGDEPQLGRRAGLALAARVGILSTSWHLLSVRGSRTRSSAKGSRSPSARTTAARSSGCICTTPSRVGPRATCGKGDRRPRGAAYR